MSERNAVQQAVDGFGKEAGMEKKSGSWYRRGGEVISISNLQKSQYGPRYYFNQGFWLRELDDERYPKSNWAHISTRLEGLLPDAQQRIGELLDLEYEMPGDKRVSELLALLNERLRPLIERGDSIAGLRRRFDRGPALDGR